MAHLIGDDAVALVADALQRSQERELGTELAAASDLPAELFLLAEIAIRLGEIRQAIEIADR